MLASNAETSPDRIPSISQQSSMLDSHAPVMMEATRLASNLAGLRTDLLPAESPSSSGRRHVSAIERRSSERHAGIRSSLEPSHVRRRHESWRRRPAVEAGRDLHVARSGSRGSHHTVWWTLREGAWRKVWCEHPWDRSVPRIVHDVDTWRRRDHGALRRHLRRTTHLKLGHVMMV